MRVLPALVAVGGAASLADAQRVVSMGIGKAKRLPPLHKRTILQELHNNLTGGGYYAEVSVGTPPQTVRLVVDTGSSDVWVLDSNADLCTSRRMQEVYGGGCIATFDPSESSTYTALSDAPFQIAYLDGSGANGTYFEDHINISGTEIESLQMGLAEEATINSGLLGIGYSTNVAATDPYPTIIDLLERQGLIALRAYSLWLNAYTADMGTILFGGVDTEKFVGELIAVPILPDSRTGDYYAFAVALSSLVLNYTDGSTDPIIQQPVPVILDSGTTLTYLPTPITDNIYSALGAVDDTRYTGLVYIDCAYLRNESGLTFDFQFGGPSGPLVRVPVNEVVLDNVQQYVEMGLSDLPDMPFADDVCSFGIHPGDQDIYLLGDTFLRSAYVVYDLENHQVAMAQAHINSPRSNVLEITRDGIPDVSGVASQVTAEQTATGLPGPGGNLPTVTVTASPDPTAGSKTLTAPPAWEVAAVAAAAALSGLMGVGLFVL
ncbi:hypothetical protein DL768_008065 [Monosporascus sp. mg162]|nr:hypothetical protein DL768_008065 [Monosporascus sp. mg162]